jgi:hypothetical protein
MALSCFSQSYALERVSIKRALESAGNRVRMESRALYSRTPPIVWFSEPRVRTRMLLEGFIDDLFE